MIDFCLLLFIRNSTIPVKRNLYDLLFTVLPLISKFAVCKCCTLVFISCFVSLLTRTISEFGHLINKFRPPGKCIHRKQESVFV